ncbi:CCA tRNA nucleotidyltransferase, mitochondrial [Modicella reniformis]|uniref:CCA tRNA nucleotidyltransferase, mitochondrial n=1 Tax=Modicella reniformis TaxID=1440133 RepID=A0A9P6SV91_9FUNG|nr:CCA tRNA nucleotidyltransferase, mitochondrial [Modicella reniformis]
MNNKEWSRTLDGNQENPSKDQNDRHQMTVQLTTTESRICGLLDRVSKNYEDKLLGLSCSDIDIGVESMLGYDFANLVADHLKKTSPHNQRKTIIRIPPKPFKGKHLETATMFILGIPIDFVNLRSETYDDPDLFSRQVVFGLPYEDAHHRDFTINALFYNVHTDKIEDYTGKGLEDLRDGWIRTPLKAYETFRQDPLRVLRSIRFAARFHFKMTEDVKQAILDPRIRESLKTKVSKERIRDELRKMMDDDASRSAAIRLLHEFDLHQVVFPPPVTSILFKGVSGVSAVNGERLSLEEGFRLTWILEWLIRINGLKDNFYPEKDPALEQLLKQTQGFDMASHLRSVVTTEPPPPPPPPSPSPSSSSPPASDTPAEEIVNFEQQSRGFLMHTALLYPYRDMTATHGHKDWPVAIWIHKYGLKARKNEVDFTAKLMTGIHEIMDIVNSVAAGLPEGDEELEQDEKVRMGMLIREIGGNKTVNKMWPSALLFGLGIELLPKYTLLRQGILGM